MWRTTTITTIIITTHLVSSSMVKMSTATTATTIWHHHHQISICSIKFLLELKNLSLEHWNGTNATIHRIFDPCFCFICQRIHSILSLIGLHLVQNLAHVACTKNLVHICKLLRLLWRKIWGEYAIWHALSPQKLARCTWRIGVAWRSHDLFTYLKFTTRSKSITTTNHSYRNRWKSHID